MGTAEAAEVAIRTLVIGLGNPILTDDGVGIEVVCAVERLCNDDCVWVEQDTHGGLRLMERMVGFERALVVDAMRSGAEPGTVFDLTLDDMPSAHSGSSHDATLVTALDVGRRAGAALPRNEAIRLVAIEAADVLGFCEALTPVVSAAVPRAVEHVLSLLGHWGPSWPSARGVIAEPAFYTRSNDTAVFSTGGDSSTLPRPR